MATTKDLDEGPDAKATAQQLETEAAHEASQAETEARAADLGGIDRGQAAHLAFGAVVAAARQAHASGEPLDVELAGLEAKLPAAWIGAYAGLHGLLKDRKAPTDANLVRQLGGGLASRMAAAVRDGQGMASVAGDAVEHLRSLPDVPTPAAGRIGGHRGARRVRLTHNGYIGPGWKPRRPRPVTIGGITLPVGASLELTVSDRDYLRWNTRRGVDCKVLKGEPSRVPTKV